MSLRMAKPKFRPPLDRAAERNDLRQVKAVLAEGNVQVGRESSGTDSSVDRRLQTDRIAVAAERLERVGWSAFAGFTPLSFTSMSKSMPIRSKKLSLSRMKRTSIVTCKSCRRRSCCSRSAISSWTA